MRVHRFIGLLSLTAIAALAMGAPAASATVIGQVATGSVQVDGIAAPPGTTVLSENVLATGQDSALLYLDSGQTALLKPKTKARFEVTESGELMASVGEGELLVSQPGGEFVRVASNSLASFNQEGLGEGEKVEGTVTMCECVKEDEDGTCDDWDAIEVAASEVDAKLAEGLVVAGDNDLDLDGNCEEEAFVPFWTTGKKVLVGVLIAGGAIVLLDDDDDADTDTDASPAGESGN